MSGPSRNNRAPTLEGLLPLVARPGRHVRLNLTELQRRALAADRDGNLALYLLRTQLRARDAATRPKLPPFSFPFTKNAIVAIGQALGLQIGEKRAYRMIRLLVATGVLVRNHSYRRRSRYTGDDRVPLFRLGVRITGLRSALSRKPTGGRSGAVKPPDATRRRQETRTCWEHGLFGMPDGKPPPGLTKRQLRRMRSADGFPALGTAAA